MLLALGVTAYAAEFTDVPAGSDYAEAVQWASDNGYIYGYGDGRFGVNDNVTRAQLATIFHRAAGTPPHPAHPASLTRRQALTTSMRSVGQRLLA